MSWCSQPSAAHLSGVVWVQGIAFGSPVVPDENRMLVAASGAQATGVNAVSSLRNASQPRSPSRLTGAGRPPQPSTTAAGASASITLAYRGSALPPRRISSWVKIALAPVMRSRTRISSTAKLSAMPTAVQPANTMPR